MFSHCIAAKDLKIGNIVEYNDKYYKVISIEQDPIFSGYLNITISIIHYINSIIVPLTVNKLYPYIYFVANTLEEIVWIYV